MFMTMMVMKMKIPSMIRDGSDDDNNDDADNDNDDEFKLLQCKNEIWKQR